MPDLTRQRPPGSPEVNQILALAARIVATDVVGEAIERATAELMATSPQSTTSAGAARHRAELPQAMVELARAMACQAAADDPTRPRFNWSPHVGWRFGLDNPDTIYRPARVDSDGSFVIEGRRNAARFVAFQLFDDYYAADGNDPVQLGFLDGSQLEVAADGSFTITLSAEPAGGRSNHIQLPRDAKALLVRDTLSDWNEVPMELTIRRLDRSPGEPTALDELASRCARWVEIGAPYWDRITTSFTSLPANTITPPRPTSNGLDGQYSSAGHFVLDGDQALVVRMPTYAAPYFGIQIGNAWFISTDYVSSIGSLNNAQAETEGGWVTVVISPTDPGVHNWIDTTGLPTGLIFLRWQGLTAAPAGGRPRAELVDHAGLAAIVGSSVRVDRQAQLAERRKTYNLRLRSAHVPVGWDVLPTLPA